MMQLYLPRVRSWCFKNSMTEKNKKSPPSARNKMMDLLARREHSEKEIRQKLKKKFTAEEIDRAVEFGKANAWLPNSEDAQQALAQKAADSWHRKKKGLLYINAQLQKRGLPSIQSEPEVELEKALELVENKYQISLRKDAEEGSSKKLAEQIGRFLVSRGFEMSVVRKVVYGKLKFE